MELVDARSANGRRRDDLLVRLHVQWRQQRLVVSQRNGTDSDGEFDKVDINAVQPPPQAVPEPSAIALLGGALRGT